MLKIQDGLMWCRMLISRTCSVAGAFGCLRRAFK